MLIIDHIDAKIAELRREFLAALREGREQHTREHAEQVKPLQDWFERERRSEERRDARVRPLVLAAVWVTDHWIVSGAVFAGLFALLVHFGIIR